MKCGPYPNDHNLIRRLYFTYNETSNLPGLNSLGGYSFSFDYHALMRVIVATPTNVALVEKTMTDYEKLMEQGHGDEDISSLYRLKRHS